MRAHESGTPARVIVFSPNWLGDAVLALPALGDLRRRYPAARLIVAARDTVASLYGLTPGVDEVVPLEWKGQALAVLSRRHDLSRLRALQADVAILLPNSFSSAWLAARAGVRERWGYAGDFRRSLLSRAVLRPAVRGHQSDYYRHLVRELGVENGPLEPGLDVPEALGESARTLVRSYGWDGSRPLAVLAPGAANGAAKRWPTAHFARLISRLVLEHGAFCALVGGDADRQTTDAVRAQIDSAVRGSVADLAGATTLQVLAGLFHVADVCVSNDSGAMHLAGAVGVPLAALFGPTRERETAPLTRTGGPAEVIINHVWCRPCMLRECPLDHRCMEQLAPDRVVASVVGLMGQRAGAR